MIAATTIWSLFDPASFLAGSVVVLIIVMTMNIWFR
jgi:hypothetical protein